MNVVAKVMKMAYDMDRIGVSNYKITLSVNDFAKVSSACPDFVTHYILLRIEGSPKYSDNYVTCTMLPT